MTSFAFLSNNSFLKSPAATPEQPFAVAGVAWDGAVTNRPGARFGPRTWGQGREVDRRETVES